MQLWICLNWLVWSKTCRNLGVAVLDNTCAKQRAQLLLYVSGVPVLKPISNFYYLNGGVSSFQKLFDNFVLFLGPENCLRKRFFKNGISLLPCLLRRALVVIFFRPWSGDLFNVNFWSSWFRYIGFWVGWCCGRLFDGSKRPWILWSDRAPAPGLEEMSNIESARRVRSFF